MLLEESAKLRAPRPLVPQVPGALRALVPHVPGALCALVPHVPLALRILVSYVPRALHALVRVFCLTGRALGSHGSEFLTVWAKVNHCDR